MGDDAIIVGVVGIAVAGFLFIEFMKHRNTEYVSQSSVYASPPVRVQPQKSYIPQNTLNDTQTSEKSHIVTSSIPKWAITPPSNVLTPPWISNKSQQPTTTTTSVSNKPQSTPEYVDRNLKIDNKYSYTPPSSSSQSSIPSWKRTSGNGVYNIYSAQNENTGLTGKYAPHVYGNPDSVAPPSGTTRTVTICNKSNLDGEFWYYEPGTDYHQLTSGSISQQTYYNIAHTKSVKIPAGGCRTITMAGWEDQVAGGVGSAEIGQGHQIWINDIKDGATYNVS